VDQRKEAQSAPPTVSFVIPARNEERFVGECIESLNVQEIASSFEIVVVDNGSTDATSSRAADYGVRVVFEPRPGLANARQAGLAAAKGEFLIFVDADTRLPVDWARNAVQRFEADADLVGLTTEFSFYDGRAIDNAGNFVFRNVLSPATNWVLRHTGRPEVLIGSAIAIRTTALRRANGVDLEFQFYGEDTMLACRLRSQGNVRFISDFSYFTSARRYQQRGLLSVVYRYFLVFALIHLGRITTASALASRFREADRRDSSNSQHHPLGNGSFNAGGYFGEAQIAIEEVGIPEPGLSPEV
jgi:glycosyltransferase involved in cell wall biosynthesis